MTSRAGFIVPENFQWGQRFPARDQASTGVRFPTDLYDWMAAYKKATGVSKNKQMYLAMREFQEKYTI